MQNDWKDTLREVMAAFISLLLVGITIYFWHALANNTSDTAAKLEQFKNMKEVLLTITPLTGTAIGYYLGRVSAERSADRSQQAAKEAIQESAQVVAAARQAVIQARDALPNGNDPTIVQARQNLDRYVEETARR
ncbi:MAG: hypothetical protein ACO1SV_00650 [Fimbriimonas sp.]